MQEIFVREEQVITTAGELLEQNLFSSKEDENNYKNLYYEYKSLLKQIKTVVKLSDLIQMELKNISEELILTSQTDSLTELYNKGYFNERYKTEWENAIQSNKPISLIMVDIDLFKKYNDTYGHLLGDECLKAVADEMRHTIHTIQRPKDMIARFGGEEFIILLPETEIEGAAEITGDLVRNIEALGIEHKGSMQYNKVTISAGVASALPKVEDNMDILLKQADSALYIAKNEGRNCFRKYDSAREV